MEALTNTKQILKQKQGKTPTYLLAISALLLAGSLHAQTQMTGLTKDSYGGSSDNSGRDVFWLKVDGSNSHEDGGEFISHTASPFYNAMLFNNSPAPNEDGISIFSRKNEMLRLTDQVILFGDLKMKDDADIYGLDILQGFNDLRFQASSTSGTNLFISSSGNVGIGTSNATQRLEVNGNIRVADDADIFGLDVIQGYNDLVFQATSTSGTNMHISSSGNIGIGMSSATQRLEVNGNIKVADDADIFGLDVIQGYNDLVFQATSTSGTNMHISSSGNVGIGVSNAAQKLHVSSGTSGDARILLEADTDNNNENDNPLIQFRQDAGSNGANIGFDEPNFGPNRFGIGRKFGSDYWDSFVIDITNGNVGVGTSAPAANLHVNHDLYVAASNKSWGTQGKGIYMRYVDNNSQDAAFIQSVDRTGITYHPIQFDASDFFFQNGKVGIGMDITNTLNEYFEVMPDADESAVIGRAHIGHKGYTDFAGFSHYDHNNGVEYAFGQWASGFTAINAPSGQTIGFRINNEEQMTLASDGRVGIGTDPTAAANAAFRLAVDGHIKAKEVEVNVAGWPDYVFADEYTLQPLEEVEDFIVANKHLPNVPSEKEVEENGVKLGEMDAVLLRKIEELTLYVIDLKKQLEEVKNNK